MAREYGIRPSEYIGVKGGLLAWDFDIAIFTFGRNVNNKLKEKTKDGKNFRYTFEQALGLPPKEQSAFITVETLQKVFKGSIRVVKAKPKEPTTETTTPEVCDS